MFYAIPLENKPTWRNPPWMTVLLILACMAVFWGPQRTEEQGQEKAAQYYLQSSLPELELPAFVAWLEKNNAEQAKLAKELLKHKAYAPLLEGMQQRQDFLRQLHAGQIITPDHAQYARWEEERQQYESLLPPPFTARWAQDYAPGADFKPWTWLSAAFLHGSTAHLLGNMLFLFLFGFSLELALGRGLYLALYLVGAAGAGALAAWAYTGRGGYGLGASGAISALMAMYAMMYRLRRIRFFYQLFFYFNYVRAPAVILLPAWIGNELLQHFVGGQGIAYMAHLGGLLTGALAMASVMRVRTVQPPEASAAPSSSDEAFARHTQAAQRLAAEMNFEAACAQWRAAARLRPSDEPTLRAWFNLAKLWPAGEDFHRAARAIFRLKGQDDTTLALQYASYKIYFDQAKPHMRLQPNEMARLAQRFARSQHLDDAQRLCQALLKTAPTHPELGDTLSLCAAALIQAGQRDKARSWLPQLQQLAPGAMATRMLQQ